MLKLLTPEVSVFGAVRGLEVALEVALEVSLHLLSLVLLCLLIFETVPESTQLT